MENRIPPRSEAIEKLENYLWANRFPANSRIPSERDLCEMWDLNRTTLRYAIDELIAEGRLYRKKGSGTFVAEPKLIKNLFGTDALTSEIRDSGLMLTTRMISNRTIESNKQITKNLHLLLGEPVYENIRLRFVSGEPCVIDMSYIAAKSCPGFDEFDLEKESISAIVKNIYKKNIVDGREKISVTYATEKEGELLEVPEGTPLFYCTGVTTTADSVPFEYYKMLFRGDRFRFVSTSRREIR